MPLILKLVRGAERATGVQPLVQLPQRQTRFVIGRDPKCDWPIADRELALSARHCEIVALAGGQHVLRDLSTNGTFVNGSRQRLAGDHVLRHGDRVGLGSYLIEVSHANDAAAAPPPPLPRTRIAARGGDPAAAVGSDWQHADAALGAPSLEMHSGFTRISKPWLDTSDAGLSSVFATVPNVRPAGPDDAGASTSTPPPAGAAAADAATARDGDRLVERNPAPAADGAIDPSQVWLRHLAAGLGVPPETLSSTSPADTAHRVGRLLRVAMYALHHQLALQSRQMRELGSRAATALAGSPAARLRMAGGPQEAVQALLAAGADGEAMLVRAHGELGQHTQRILAAFETTCQRLAEQLDPATFERLMQGADDPARLWLTYGALWRAMGLGDQKTWPEGFVDAAFAHLATAYDETPPAGRA